MTLKEKMVIVAEAMADGRFIWIDGMREKPIQLTQNRCDNPSINIRTSHSDCSLAGVEVSATRPAESIKLRLSDAVLTRLIERIELNDTPLERDIACALRELEEIRAENRKRGPLREATD